MDVFHDIPQAFFTNLQLLGFDAVSVEKQYRIPCNKYVTLDMSYFTSDMRLCIRKSMLDQHICTFLHLHLYL